MKKTDLQQWIRESGLPDQWWISIAGSVGDVPHPLETAFSAAAGRPLHVCHVTKADEGDWWAVEAGPPPVPERRPKPTKEQLREATRIAVPPSGTICIRCGHIGRPRTHVKGSFLLEVFLWLLLIVPGLIYSVWRASSASRQKICAECGSAELVPLATPGGQSAYRHLHAGS